MRGDPIHRALRTNEMHARRRRRHHPGAAALSSWSAGGTTWLTVRVSRLRPVSRSRPASAIGLALLHEAVAGAAGDLGFRGLRGESAGVAGGPRLGPAAIRAAMVDLRVGGR